MNKRDSKASLTDLLRQSVAGYESLLALERESGVKRQSLRLFMLGRQSLRLDMAEKLMAHFGIEARRVRKGKS